MKTMINKQRPYFIDYFIFFILSMYFIGTFSYFLEVLFQINEFSPYREYNNNEGIFKIKSLDIFFQFQLLILMIIWFFNKKVNRKKISFYLSILAIIIGVLVWFEYWYGSTFYYGEVRDKQGIVFPVFSTILISYPFWNIEFTKSRRTNFKLSIALTIMTIICLFLFYNSVRESWILFSYDIFNSELTL